MRLHKRAAGGLSETVGEPSSDSFAVDSETRLGCWNKGDICLWVGVIVEVVGRQLIGVLPRKLVDVDVVVVLMTLDVMESHGNGGKLQVDDAALEVVVGWTPAKERVDPGTCESTLYSFEERTAVAVKFEEVLRICFYIKILQICS
jgi:hypothetical protein